MDEENKKLENNKNETREERTKKFLNEMYEDFFYLLSKNNDDITSINEKKDIPTIEVKKQHDSVEETHKKELDTEKPKVATDINKENTLNLIHKKIEDSHLTLDSQNTLKKMIDYARKFDEGVVKKYIPFNMRIYCDNDETLYKIINLIIDGFKLYNYIKDEEAVERSFFIVDDSRHIQDLYDTRKSIIVFKDCDGLLNKDKSTRDKLLNVWETEILESSNYYGSTTIIVDSSKEKVDELFSNNITLKDKIFDFELSTDKADPQEVYQAILNNFKNDYIVTGEFELKLLDYVTETYSKTTLSSPEYITSTTEKILFNQVGEVVSDTAIPEYEQDKSIDEIFKELNELVGLENIKVMLKDLVSLVEFKKKAGDDLKLKNTNLHMVFLGNPGTGKTTVARMVAGILYNLKYISQNKLIEVSAKDLIGQYVGQTAPKTMSVIEKSLGGVLFIDEAYSLASKPGNNSSFNEECIATLIQAMENYRDNLVVIFAGYSKEMDAFLKSNSGIVSRIGYTMEFKDYTIDELITIMDSMFRKAGFIVEDEANNKAKTIIEKYYNTEGFGNARFARNLYEKSVIKHATNVQDSDSKQVLKTITASDIADDNLGKID